MTEDRALPTAVVKRCAKAVDPAAFENWTIDPAIIGAGKLYRERDLRRVEAINATAAALAEFLTILEERGLRVVPVEYPSEGMLNRWSATDSYSREAAASVYETLMSGAPPLAELLEDREHG